MNDNEVLVPEEPISDENKSLLNHLQELQNEIDALRVIIVQMCAEKYLGKDR